MAEATDTPGDADNNRNEPARSREAGSPTHLQATRPTRDGEADLNVEFGRQDEHRTRAALENSIRPSKPLERSVPAPAPVRDAATRAAPSTSGNGAAGQQRPTGSAPQSESRSRDRSTASGPSAPAPVSPDRTAVPEEVRKRFIQDGNKYHFPDGARAFTDKGTKLTTPSENTEVIRSLIGIARARGWSDITIEGTDRFRREAWFAARHAGLEVRGHTPSDYEQGRLVRSLAQGLQPANTQTTTDARGRAHETSRTQEREGRGTLQIGRLIDHGEAPFRHDPKNSLSYFVRIETESGEREIWGVDLHRALKESLTRPSIGDEIGLRAVRREAVKVWTSEHDAEGRFLGEKRIDVQRNGWIVEKRDFFRERRELARTLRDPRIDRREATQRNPQLVGSYVQLHAADLAAKTFAHPDDQRKFVASVRNALADSIARGEPLPAARLVEPAPQRVQPREVTPPAVDQPPPAR